MRCRVAVGSRRLARQLRSIAGVLRSENRFLLSSHVNPDGDSVGSTCALALVLSSLGKEVTVAFQDEVPVQYRFIPGADRILIGQAVSSAAPDADTVGIILDCGELSRIGARVRELMTRCGRLIILDHHATTVAQAGRSGGWQTGYSAERQAGRIAEWQHSHSAELQPGQIGELSNAGTGIAATVVADTSMSATGELVYHLVRHLLNRVPEDIATALYVAISTDTGSFRYANTSPQSLVIAGELVAAGASPGVISEVVYDTKPITYLRLLSDALGGLKTAADGRIAYLVVTQELLQKHRTAADELEGLVNYARMVDTAVYAILFSPGAAGEVKVSFRSKGRFRVDSIAAHFGGGGHRSAAGARVRGSMEDVVDSVISHISSALED